MGLLLLLGVGISLCVRYYFLPPARQMLVLTTDFVPQPDPNCTAEVLVDPTVDTEVKLPDDARIRIPAGAFKTAATARASKLLNAPPPYGCERQLGAAYDVSVDGLQPEEPIDIELPFNATSVGADAPDEDYAIFRWNGDEWRPYPAAVDRSQNTCGVSAGSDA